MCVFTCRVLFCSLPMAPPPERVGQPCMGQSILLKMAEDKDTQGSTITFTYT